MNRDKVIQFGKVLLRTVVDAIFLFGLFAITSDGQISKTNHIRWFIYGFTLSLTLQYIYGKTIVTFNRLRKTEKSQSS